MKAATEYLWMNTPTKTAFVNITSRVAEIVRKSGVKEGLVLVNASQAQSESLFLLE